MVAENNISWHLGILGQKSYMYQALLDRETEQLKLGHILVSKSVISIRTAMLENWISHKILDADLQNSFHRFKIALII